MKVKRKYCRRGVGATVCRYVVGDATGHVMVEGIMA